ncbi:MAG TPA: hypothetical protein VKE40_16270 [Gemmataceae bacterium]|nr:hypothetical protein [Gemmataceae bacterium]
MLDLIGAVELTASAAIVIATVSIGFGRDVATRLRLAAALSVWFVVVVVLAATYALHYQYGVGSAGVGLAVFTPIVVLLVSLFGVPALREGVERVPLWLITAVQAIRILGINFLLLQADGRLPAPFAPLAGWGDIAVGVAAGPVAWLTARRGPGWRPALIVWNIVGLADLADAIVLGVLSSPGPLQLLAGESDAAIMSTLPWLLIPGFLVPLLAVLHVVSFYRLWRERAAGRGQ